MKLDSIQPKTIAGIKSLARDIQKARAIPYNQALGIASVQGGFANWKAALNAQSAMTPSVPSGHDLHITAWWFNDQTQQSGRETLVVRTLQPIGQMLNRRQLKMKRYIGGKRLIAPDHLMEQRRFDTQEEARHNVAGAARTLAFIEATGLKPSGAKFPDFGPLGTGFNLPGCDHFGIWYDPVTKVQIITDEPYKSRIDREGSAFEDRRRAWAERHNWIVQPVNWAGMHYPDIGSRLFLIAPASAMERVSDLICKLNALPPPASSVDWRGETGAYGEEYLSPAGFEIREARLLAQQRRKEVPGRLGPRNSISYTSSFGGRNRSRPNAKLDLAIHREMGRLLRQATAFGKPWGRTANGIGRLRTELDDWLALEYPRNEITHREFVEVYYGGAANPGNFTRRELEQPVPAHLLGQVRTLLVNNYPECAPLRTMVGRIDSLVARISS